jgi:hypothetical protein
LVYLELLLELYNQEIPLSLPNNDLIFIIIIIILFILKILYQCIFDMHDIFLSFAPSTCKVE